MRACASLVKGSALLLSVGCLRRLSRRSGVTDAEFFAPLPGDELIPHPMVEWTRGTTLDAPPGAVWPWLVQMGYGRGGWYTSERFDRLVWRIDNPSADAIVPQWQDLAAGDIVPDGPDYAAYFRVAEVREHEAIVYHSIRHPYRGRAVDPDDEHALLQREQALIEGGTYIDFSWAFVLRPVDRARTRLIIRTRANYGPPAVRLLEVPLGLIDLFHVSTMFAGINGRVRRAVPG